MNTESKYVFSDLKDISKTYNNFDTCENLFGDPIYLDNFLNKSKEYSHLLINKRIRTRIGRIAKHAIFLGIFIAITILPLGLEYPFLFFLYPIIFAPSCILINRIATMPNDYSRIDDHIHQCIKSNIHSLAPFFNNDLPNNTFRRLKESICLNDSSKNTQSGKQKLIFKVLIVIYFAFIFLFCVTYVFHYRVNSFSIIIVMLVLSGHAVMGLYQLSIALDCFRLKFVCSKKVDAVCIDKCIDNPKEYIYYKYNDKNYIIVIPHPYYKGSQYLYCARGEYIKDMKINPNNPFECYSSRLYPKKAFALFFSFAFLFPTLLIWFKFTFY